MKRVTASEARRNWFTLLDEVANGEVVAIIRKGTRIILRRDKSVPSKNDRPHYHRILRVKDADRADSWGWAWTESGVKPRANTRK